jgi:polyisoprenoid-binding protein YceI
MAESASATDGPATTAGGPQSVRYRIDPAASRFTVQAFAAGMLSALAHSPRFAARQVAGEAELDLVNGASASLKLTIQSQSLELLDDLSSKDRKEIERVMQEEVLETARYPNIVYECPASAASLKRTGDGQFDVTMNGTLTLHGVTRTQAVTARVVASPSSLRAFGEFSVKQTDYRIKLVSMAGSMLQVKDEIKCTFDVVARP